MDADPVTPSAGADDGSRTPDSSRLGFARRSSLDNSRMLVSRNSGGGAGGSNPWADDSVVAEPPAGFDDDDSGTQHARRSSVTLLSAPSAPRRRSFDIGSASTLGGDGGGGADTRFSADELLDAAEQEMLDMQAEFERVLRSVERVQKSWAVIEKDRPRHGVALMAEFFRLAPDALPLFSFSDAAGRPGWVITEDKRVQRHAVTVISTVGAAVAGLRRFDQLMPTLHRVGKAHWPQHKDARLYFAPMGQALITVLREALGDAFTDDVEEGARLARLACGSGARSAVRAQRGAPAAAAAARSLAHDVRPDRDAHDAGDRRGGGAGAREAEPAQGAAGRPAARAVRLLRTRRY